MDEERLVADDVQHIVFSENRKQPLHKRVAAFLGTLIRQWTQHPVLTKNTRVTTFMNQYK